MIKLNARDTQNNSKTLAHQYFKELLTDSESYDYQFVGIKLENLMVIGGFAYHIPAFIELCKNSTIGKFINDISKDESHFFQINWISNSIEYYVYSKGNIVKRVLDKDIQLLMLELLFDYKEWAGYLDENGDHIINLKKPSPGPHFSTNMLLGKTDCG